MMPNMKPPNAQPNRPAILRKPPIRPMSAIDELPPSRSVKAGRSTSENNPKSVASSAQPAHTTRKTAHWYRVRPRGKLRVASTAPALCMLFPRLLVMRSRESPCYQPRGAGITRCVVHPNFFDEIPEPVIFQPRLDRPDDARGVCVMGDDIALVESRHPCLLRVRLPQDSPDKLRHRREVR